jgi:hypothetical protein
MNKTFRIDYSKGINAVTDRRMTPDGYLVLADNIDLRSGSMRPFTFPEIYSTLTVPAGTKDIFEFRNKWYFSPLYRAYAAEVLPSQERVYFTESGVGHVIPQKVVNGVQADLGTPRPSFPPNVTQSSAETVTGLTLTTATTGGNLASGVYSYRISAIIAGQVLTPCQASIIIVPQDIYSHTTYTNTITLTWAPVLDATGYLIFGRVQGTEQVLQQTGVTTSWIDEGGKAPSGTYATAYDAINPLTYVYTYVRDVGGMEDESGPSPVSISVPTGTARKVARVPMTDGFYADATSKSLVSKASSWTSAFVGILYKANRLILTMTTAPDQTVWLPSNMKAVFSGLDPVSSKAMTGEPFAFSFPTAIPNINVNTPTIYSATGGTWGAETGTHDYAVVAVRGQCSIYPSALLSEATTAIGTPASVNVSSNTNVVSVSWGAISDADGYILYRRFGSTWSRVITIVGQTVTYRDTGSYEATSVTPPATNTTSTRAMVMQMNGVPAGLTVASNSPVSLCRTDFINPYTTFVERDDAVYITTSSDPTLLGSHPALQQVTDNTSVPKVYNTLSGVSVIVNASAKTFTRASGSWAEILKVGSLVTFTGFLNTGNNSTFTASTVTDLVLTCTTATGLVNETGTPTATTYDFYLPLYTTADATNTVYDVPGNNFIKSWRIYRSGDTGDQTSFVAEVPIADDSYIDSIGVTGLGDVIPSYYLDSSGSIIVYEPSPTNLGPIELYNGMLFGITGNQVCWTPTGVPDAWPSAYRMTFPYPPLNLRNYSDGLCVFCQDRIYRLDGFSPSEISRHDTVADGCIAPRSVQILGGSLFYLAKRGVMEFKGMNANCITENVIPYKLLIKPSAYAAGFSQPKYFWYPTVQTAAYGQILTSNNSPIPGIDGASPILGVGTILGSDKSLDDVLYDARSFTWQNKYFLYFTNDTGNYLANACWCIDNTLPTDAVTTLGIKPLDAHVSSDGEAYVLLEDMSTVAGNHTKLASFLLAQSQYSTATMTSTASDHLGVYKFNPVQGMPVPMRFRTPEITAGSPNARKRWRGLLIHGDGSLWVRVYLDGALMTFADGTTKQQVDCTDLPDQPRRVLFPIGSWGYSVSVEGIADHGIRIIEVNFDPMPGEE